MNERDRLIELIQNAVDGCARHWAEIIADYLLANGVIVPPVKVGDTAYELRARGLEEVGCRKRYADYAISGQKRMDNAVRRGLELYVREKYFTKTDVPRLGKTIFLTREEAEQALKEREQE